MERSTDARPVGYRHAHHPDPSPPGQLPDRLLSEQPGDVGISSLTAAQLVCGVQRSRDPEQNARALEQFLLPTTVAPFDAPAASVYGEVRASREAAGRPIGGMDTRIGSHARSLRAVLVTGNVREFSRIGDLALENWLEDAGETDGFRGAASRAGRRCTSPD